MIWAAVPGSKAPVVSAAEMRAADQQATDRYGIASMQLMEAAGLQLAAFTQSWLGDVGSKSVAVIAGGGNNGGDALAAARYLWGRGIVVEVWALPPRPASSLMRHHLFTAEHLGIPCHVAGADPYPVGADVILDGLLGTGVQPPLRGLAASIVAWINATSIPCIAVDIPSGLDADSGAGEQECVRATATLTLGLPKPALLRSACTGRLFAADIGLPPELFGPLAAAVRRLYKQAAIIELTRSPSQPS